MKKDSKFQSLSTKAKIQFIWDYYRWHILVGLCVLVFGISTLHDVFSYRDPILNITMINSYISSYSPEETFADFLDTYGYETFDHAVIVDDGIYFGSDPQTAMISSQRLMCTLAAGETDMIFWSSDDPDCFSHDAFLADLSTILPAEILSAYSDEILYATDEETGSHYPCAIKLVGNKWLNDYGYYTDCYMGIPYHAVELPVVKDFCNYLLG